MSVSGTVGQSILTVAELLDQAILKTGKNTADLTAQTIQTAIREFNLMLSGFANRGINLWTQEWTLVGLNYGQPAYELPVGTLDVRLANLRTMSRLTGSYLSSAGGDPDLAFDGDTMTIFTQNAADGSVTIDLGTPFSVQTFGYYPGASSTMDLIWEWSTDGVTWYTALEFGSQSMTDAVWVWGDATTIYTARYWRLREQGGGTISAREIYLGNNGSEIPLARINADDWGNQPTRLQFGTPNMFWYDRKRVQPVIRLWNVPNNAFQLLNVLRNRHIMDVTGLIQDIEVPQRWQDFLMWSLSCRLIASGIGDPNRYQLCNAELARCTFEGEAEEKDDSPINWYPNISGYTNG